MISGILCVAFFSFCLYNGGVSIGRGLGATMACGYVYGILRANLLDGFSHFLFDSALLGFYIARLPNAIERSQDPELIGIRNWLLFLLFWPIAMFLLPLQHPLVQLAGLRSAIYFLPMVFLGALVTSKDLLEVTRWLAGLVLLAFAFGVVEFFAGVDRFFPHSPVTEIIYNSRDIAGGAFRIPATFPSSHAFAANLIAAAPFFICRLGQNPAPTERLVMTLAAFAALLGVFMAGPRSPVVLMFLQYVLFFGMQKVRGNIASTLFAIATLVALCVAADERLQRFVSLSDTDFVLDRLSQSVNFNLVSSVVAYPMGAGLGRGNGTSVPYFLAHLALPRIGAENEYARIAVEQGVVGLAAWLGFICWHATRRATPISQEWGMLNRLVSIGVTLTWATAFVGAGTLLSIPASAFMLFQMGMTSSDRAEPPPVSTEPVRSRWRTTPPRRNTERERAATG